MPYERQFFACARAVKALARQHAYSGAYEHWLMKYAICTPILWTCESSEGSGKTACILNLVWVLTERKWPYVRPICACAKAVKALAKLQPCSGAWRNCNRAQARLSIDWWNMQYVPQFCACVRAVKALVRLHACYGLFEHWLIKYAIYTPILCMCENSEGSGKTACKLSLVWALTEKICHMYAHFVHVREQ